MEYKTKDLGILLEDTPETYYWIGFLLADGTFYRKDRAIGLCLGDKDKEHLLKFRAYVKSSCAVTIRKTKGTFDSNTSVLRQIWVSYKEVVPTLMDKFGIYSRKTYNPPDLPIIENNNLFFSLLIGFIDGDGSISTVNNKYTEIRIKIHKTWDVLLQNFIYRLYNFIGVSSPKGRYIKDKYYVCTIGNSKAMRLLKNKAIELKLPILQRKWNKIDLNFISEKEIASNNKISILNNLKQGKTRKEISDIVNLNYSSVCRIIRKSKW